MYFWPPHRWQPISVSNSAFWERKEKRISYVLKGIKASPLHNMWGFLTSEEHLNVVSTTDLVLTLPSSSYSPIVIASCPQTLVSRYGKAHLEHALKIKRIQHRYHRAVGETQVYGEPTFTEVITVHKIHLLLALQNSAETCFPSSLYPPFKYETSVSDVY